MSRFLKGALVALVMLGLSAFSSIATAQPIQGLTGLNIPIYPFWTVNGSNGSIIRWSSPDGQRVDLSYAQVSADWQQRGLARPGDPFFSGQIFVNNNQWSLQGYLYGYYGQCLRPIPIPAQGKTFGPNLLVVSASIPNVNALCQPTGYTPTLIYLTQGAPNPNTTVISQ